MAQRSTRVKLHIGASRLHRWLALIIGIQLLLWFASGLVMSLIPIERVRGEHLVKHKTSAPLPLESSYAPLSKILGRTGEPVPRLEYRTLLGRPVVEIETASGQVRLHDALSGDPLTPISPAQVRSIAVAAFREDAVPAPKVERVTATTVEYKGKLPAWRAQFADADATRIYLDDIGQIVAVRTGTWRFYDLFWALHIMDWTEHERFNTPWLKASAFGGLTLAIAGTFLLFLRWPRRRRKQLRGTLSAYQAFGPGE